ncbi:major facilitator superfamily protein [Anopheles sinensis]|uniref:Major facilitator superfamily protein n=1 Tax=Anopheles sinensis TaxID=74873 RepID=A0A084WL57_ANOSI|nr:major facilitator superfamily protein [Anopheles sinensis]
MGRFNNPPVTFLFPGCTLSSVPSNQCSIPSPLAYGNGSTKSPAHRLLANARSPNANNHSLFGAGLALGRGWENPRLVLTSTGRKIGEIADKECTDRFINNKRTAVVWSPVVGRAGSHPRAGLRNRFGRPNRSINGAEARGPPPALLWSAVASSDEISVIFQHAGDYVTLEDGAPDSNRRTFGRFHFCSPSTERAPITGVKNENLHHPSGVASSWCARSKWLPHCWNNDTLRDEIYKQLIQLITHVDLQCPRGPEKKRRDRRAPCAVCCYAILCESSEVEEIIQQMRRPSNVT